MTWLEYGHCLVALNCNLWRALNEEVAITSDGTRRQWNDDNTPDPLSCVCHWYGCVTPHSAALRVSPTGWGETLAAAPALDRTVGGAVPGLVRRWHGIPPEINQLALDQHYLSIHLGGAKRLHRDGEGQQLVRDAPAGAHSVVPAGSAYRWRTEGPIDFLHVYFASATIDRFVATELERDPNAVDLRDCLGINDPLLGSLTLALADELTSDEGVQQAYLDDIMHLLLFRMLRHHAGPASRSQHALPPYKLRRAIDFIESRCADPIGVTEIAAAVGTSAFHFSRAFRHATGRPPYAYLLERRIARAQELLASAELTLADIAARCGFGGVSQFSRMFKRATGVSPSDYRNRR